MSHWKFTLRITFQNENKYINAIIDFASSWWVLLNRFRMCQRNCRKWNWNFFFHSVSGKEHILEGHVESIHYGKFHCQIAIAGGEEDTKYVYHRVKHLHQCEFAERCKNAGIAVKVACIELNGICQVYSIATVSKNVEWEPKFWIHW